MSNGQNFSPLMENLAAAETIFNEQKVDLPELASIVEANECVELGLSCMRAIAEIAYHGIEKSSIFFEKEDLEAMFALGQCFIKGRSDKESICLTTKSE